MGSARRKTGAGAPERSCGRTLVLSAFVLLTLLLSACGLLSGVSAQEVYRPPSGSLSVSFIDVGQGDGVLVLAGDVEAKEEEYMANGPYAGPLTILKVSHHGSNTSTTPLFLSRFPPKVAVEQSPKRKLRRRELSR